jgi:hypothetical protein
MALARLVPISSRSGRSTNYLRSRVPQMFRSVCLAGPYCSPRISSKTPNSGSWLPTEGTVTPSDLGSLALELMVDRSSKKDGLGGRDGNWVGEQPARRLAGTRWTKSITSPR